MIMVVIARFLMSQGHSCEITTTGTLVVSIGVYRYDFKLHGMVLGCTCTQVFASCAGYGDAIGFDRFSLADPELFSKIIDFIQRHDGIVKERPYRLVRLG